MHVAVLVPWRPGDEHREAAWAWVKAGYASEHPGWQVIEGTCPDGPWIKALAVQAALDQTDADCLVIADADVWCAELPVDLLTDHHTVVPHKHVHRLTPASTSRLLAGEPWTPHAGFTLEQPKYVGRMGGGITIIRRDVWDRVPMDPRFQGWGHEDDSWQIARRAIVGAPKRLAADLLHLWHPPQERVDRSSGSPESRDLNRRYMQAQRSPVAMQPIVDEARALLEVTRCS